MRAASLNKRIRIERAVVTVNAYGVPHEAWETLCYACADVAQALDETRHESGARSEISATFTIRFLDDVQLSDRIVYRDQVHDIVQIVEIGRRRALKIATMGRPA